MSTEKTEFIAKHCPVSYVLCDSLGETLSQCHKDPQQLIVFFLRDVLKLRKKLMQYMTENFRDVFDDINQLLTESWQEVQHYEEHDPCQGIDKEQNPIKHRLALLNKTWANAWYKRLVLIKQDLMKYIKQVPVLGYNSAHYDINLIKQHLITLLMEGKKNKTPLFLTDENIIEDHFPDIEIVNGLKYPEYEAEVRDFADLSVIKQGGSYTQLIVGHKLLFLDIYKYQSPNTSLDDFMKTYKAPVSKDVFPYEYLTPDTLYSKKLPKIEDFYSRLKVKNMLGKAQQSNKQTIFKKLLRCGIKKNLPVSRTIYYTTINWMWYHLLCLSSIG